MKKLISAAVVALLSASALVAFASSPASAASPCGFNDPQVQYACAIFANFGGHTFDEGEAAFWAGLGQRDGRFAEVGGLLYSPELMASQVIGSVYQALLDRQPDPAGTLFWTTAVSNQSVTYEQLIGIFGASSEGMAFLSNNDFIGIVYNAFLGRDPSAEDLGFWSDRAAMFGRLQITEEITSSSESNNAVAAVLFQSYLNRAPDAASLAFWSGFKGQHGYLELIHALVASDEAYARFSANPVLATTAGAVGSALAG